MMTKQNKLSTGILAFAIVLMSCFQVLAQATSGNQASNDVAKQQAADKEAALKASGPLTQKQYAAGMASDQKAGTTQSVRPTDVVSANGLATGSATSNEATTTKKAASVTTPNSPSAQGNAVEANLAQLEASLAVIKAEMAEKQGSKTITQSEIDVYNKRMYPIENKIKEITRANQQSN